MVDPRRAQPEQQRIGALPGEVRRVADELLVRVITGRYPAGLRFPSEPAIAEELGCGRSTVREALRHLAGLGVVQSRRGSGATVLDFRREGTPSLLTQYLRFGTFDQPAAVIARELLELRTLLATEAVRLASRYAAPGDLVDARAQLDRAKGLTHDALAHGKSELLFFRALVLSSRIWPAVWLANAFWGPLHDLLDLLGPFVAAVRGDYQERMDKLLALIVAHDETRAMRHVKAWLADVDETLMNSVEGAFQTESSGPRAGARGHKKSAAGGKAAGGAGATGGKVARGASATGAKAARTARATSSATKGTGAAKRATKTKTQTVKTKATNKGVDR